MDGVCHCRSLILAVVLALSVDCVDALPKGKLSFAPRQSTSKIFQEVLKDGTLLVFLCCYDCDTVVAAPNLALPLGELSPRVTERVFSRLCASLTRPTRKGEMPPHQSACADSFPSRGSLGAASGTFLTKAALGFDEQHRFTL